MKTRFLSLLAILIFLSLSVVSANATTIYGNSAGSAQIHIIDSTTGIETTRYNRNPNGNGRGMVVVGDTIYYTNTNDAHIYEMDLNTGITTGSILTQNASMSTIAWDGSTFWTSDYSGTNRAFQIDPITGNNIKTINLSLAGSNMDGMEYFNGKLIANRGDTVGPYDIYDLDGNVIQANFITPVFTSTGIAFDGTDFWVSNIFNSSISRYDGITGAFKETVNLTSTNGSFLIEDLSVDYAQRQDTGGGGRNPVPEPGTMLLLGLGLLAMAGSQRKKSN